MAAALTTFASFDAMVAGLPTPAPLVDGPRMRRNVALLRQRVAALGVGLRPHVKTAKAPLAAALYDAPTTSPTAWQSDTAPPAPPAVLPCDGLVPCAVSTLAEAETFLQAGSRDVVYAVGLAPTKAAAAVALAMRFRSASPAAPGASAAVPRLTVLVDNEVAVKAAGEAVCAAMQQDGGGQCAAGRPLLGVLVELDCGHHRGGVPADSDELLAVGRTLAAACAAAPRGGLVYRGVLTHGGHGYGAGGDAERLASIAEAERESVVLAASRLETEAGGALGPASVRSTGSTPTVTHMRRADGVTDVRSGVSVFQDLDQCGIGSCVHSGADEIALTVLTTVIGHNRAANKIVVDAGGLALSKDQCAAQHEKRWAGGPVGYGLVLPDGVSTPADFVASIAPGKSRPAVVADCGTGRSTLYVAGTSQEHGHVTTRDGSQVDFARFPVGTRLRVWPHHACYTAAAYGNLLVWEPVQAAAAGSEVRVESWSKAVGW